MKKSDLKAIEINRATLEGIAKERERTKIDSFYQETGPLRRELYAKHMAFFAAGCRNRERAFICANRIGKTVVGAYEMTSHLRGVYPKWWKGRKFKTPISAIAAGDTAKTVRDIVQAALLGKPGHYGTGMIPAADFVHAVNKQGVPDAVDTIYVRHATASHSILAMKSYDQGRQAFQGVATDVIWLDEEPPIEIYSECLLRTMTTNGIILLTFTPLQGMTELVQAFVGQIGVENG